MINRIQEEIPEYASDIKYNLARVLSEKGAAGLSQKNIAAIAVATSMAAASTVLRKEIEIFAAEFLSAKEMDGAKTAHAIMSMTNVYYRFLHIADNPEYKRMPSKLRRTSENNPGIDIKSFELAALGVSAINNCKACIDYHELNLRRAGVSAEGIQSTIRIAAVINAVGELMK